ncbi:hypothetical protein CKY10_05155 [Photorhabdus sp. HUG-39]|uniref:Uncharacterized protein n=2 Tax=Photorhabdus TaxID=29487 RepID=A0ABX0AVH1_9GAMM|nr:MULTISPECIES: hypothetical protein [Photorhabdus]MCC8374592.1 hypothetical protein [Photorhabdus bodei]MDB6367719.1 hypothetical protein [Photorhabdus bodei]MDB6371310.1 hypothetical protein [Photorhabdus bodei]NDL11181.1 hypothetical protein [Photorhabdus kayaii]NDL24812.1 hypothetical protein [Photorhabdus kayaii]
MRREYSEKEKKKTSIPLGNSIDQHEIDNNPLGSGLDLNQMMNNTPRVAKDNYSEENGDLFYGLAAKRGKYIRDVNPNFDSNNPDSTPMIIDFYNNEVSRVIFKDTKILPKKSEDLVKNPKKYARNIKVKDSLQKNIIKEQKGRYPLWNDYFKIGGENKKFNMYKIFKEITSKYNSDYYHVCYNKTWLTFEPRLLWKRGSKLGIEMAARNGRTKIHFVLDGLNIEQVVNKTKGSTPLEAGPGESVTASELRYAYRNRERLAGRIHFYRDGKEVIAPWDENPTLWQNYIPQGSNRNIATQRNGGAMSRLIALPRRMFSPVIKRIF